MRLVLIVFIAGLAGMAARAQSMASLVNPATVVNVEVSDRPIETDPRAEPAGRSS